MPEQVPGVDYCDHYYWDRDNEDILVCELDPGHQCDHESYAAGALIGVDMPTRTWKSGKP